MSGAHGLLVFGIVIGVPVVDALTVGTLVRFAEWLGRKR